MAVDGSWCSEAAIREVGARPWPADTEFRVITVDAPAERSRSSRDATKTAYEELLELARRDAQDILDRAVDQLGSLLPDVLRTAALLEGSPRERIVEEAREWGADLIVVGSHGRGAIESVLLGSVSLALALQAPCSILIVRALESSSAAAREA